MHLAPKGIFILAASTLVAAFTAYACGDEDHGRIHDIAYVSEAQGQRIYVMQTNGEEIEISSGPGISPIWAPNLSSLAYLSNPRNGQGALSHWERGASNSEIVPGSPANVARFAWSPDSRRIAYQSESDDGSKTDIFMHDFGQDTTVLVASEPSGNLQLGNWSADTEWLTITLHTPETSGIFLKSVLGVNEVQLTEGEDANPAISPDGKRLAFTRLQPDGTTDIFTMIIEDRDAPGKQINLTSQQGDETNFEWAPDSVHIVYQSSSEGNSEIYRVNVESLETTRLTNNRVDDQHPRWSKNSKQVLFTSNADGDWDIYSMDLGSGAQRRLLSTDSNESDADW